MKNYDHKKIELKWQKEWEKKKIYSAQNNSKKKKFYGLIEFPYPSGDGLHVGHPRPYIGMDVIVRKRRMERYNVLYPIGWDAFGLPTENYAIQTSQDPRTVTKKNSDNFRQQIKSLGISFDWSREINTTDPKYYKWTQWIFLQFFKKGLAYKAKVKINWCPKDKTGLANEEVVNGACERCGTPVETREKDHWMLSITKYADRLDKDLDTVDYLPHVKLAQKNWIGKSEGAEIMFSVSVAEKFSQVLGKNPQTIRKSSSDSNNITVFTTRPDTIFGTTFIVIAGKQDRFTGRYVTNPVTKEKIPVWEAEYVYSNYGTGAIMAVPAHDERDYEFAKKHNLPIKNVIEPVFIDNPKPDLPFVERNAIHAIVKHWAEDKYLLLLWKKVNWITFVTGGVDIGENAKEAAIREIREETGYQNFKFIKELPRSHSKFYHVPKKENRFAHFSNFYFELQNGEQKDLSPEEKQNHDLKWATPEEVGKLMKIGGSLRDWEILKNDNIVYTGNGILINSGKFTGMDSEVAKKEIIKFVGGKEKTSFKLRDWVFSRQRYWGEPIPVVHCDKCGTIPVSEKELPLKLPVIKDYKPTDNGESPLTRATKWVNIKCPKCKGKAKRETDTMPNWAGSSWYFLRYTDHKNTKVFADSKKLKYWTPVDWYNGGNEHTTLHLLYSRFWHKFLYDLGLVPTNEPYLKRTSHGIILAEGGEKMSKSRGNVVNPDDIVKTYGADTLRLYEMFLGPFDQAVFWSEESIIGPRRFLERVWKLGQLTASQNKISSRFTRQNRAGSDATQKFYSATLKLLNKTIKKVSEDIESMSFNTAISSLMILSNEMEKSEVGKEDFKKFLQILAPFAPHIADELWHNLGQKNSVHSSIWPKWEISLLVDEKIKIVVQINGKVRSEILINQDSTEEEIKKDALSNEKIYSYLNNQIPKKMIYVKNRLINIVV